MEMNMPVTPAMFTGAGGGMFGGGSNTSDWIVFLIIAMIFGGGNLFGRGATGTAENSFISNEFNYSNLSNGIRGLERGLCDIGYNLNTSITGQGELTRGAVTSSTFETQRGFYDLSAQLASCCCANERLSERAIYEGAKNTCEIVTNANSNTRDLIEAGNSNTQRIIDMMTCNQMQELRDKNTALTLQISQQAQTANIIGQLKPNPIPAYVVSSPYCGA